MNDQILETKENALKIFNHMCAFSVLESDLELWVYPQTFGSTNPFGMGGSSMTTFSIICWRNTAVNSCVVCLHGNYQHYKRFELQKRFNREIPYLTKEYVEEHL